MNKKTLKIISIVAIIVAIMFNVFSISYALTPTDLEGAGSDVASEEIQSFGGTLMNVIQTVGVVVAVIIIMVLGIKYMMGSAEEKAEYKKTMVPYLVGAILIFAATTIANIVYNFADSL